MADAALISNVSAFIFIIGGILLTLGIRWHLLKAGDKKFIVPIFAFAITELAVGLVLALSG